MVCRHGRQVAKTQERELPTEQPDGDKLFDDDVDEFLGYDDDIRGIRRVHTLSWRLQAEFGRRPDNEFLRQPAQMNHANAGGR